MNGYFQLCMNEQGTFLKLIPETDGGEPIEIGEVAEYLEFEKIPFELTDIRDAVLSGKETTIPLCRERKFPVNERSIIKVSADRMTAEIRFYAPSDDGIMMDRKEILGDLAYQKIVYGIQEDVIDQFLLSREYCRTFVIAVGDKIVPGKDAWIEYFFNTDLRARPTLQ